MSCVIKCDETLGCIFVQWRGTFSRKEADAYSRDVAKLPGFHAGLNFFHDMRLADVKVSGAVVRDAAKVDSPPCRPGAIRKGAILVSSDVGFGMMRMLAAFRDRPGLDLDVFRDLEEAKAWLGLPEDIGDPFVEMNDDEAIPVDRTPPCQADEDVDS